MKNLKIQNIYNNGREVPNQFEIFYEKNNKNKKGDDRNLWHYCKIVSFFLFLPNEIEKV